MSAPLCPNCKSKPVPLFANHFECGAEIDRETGQFFPTLTCVARQEAQQECANELTETKRKLALAEARVKELEGLPIYKIGIFSTGFGVSVCIPPGYKLIEKARTLGESMPRNDK